MKKRSLICLLAALLVTFLWVECAFAITVNSTTASSSISLRVKKLTVTYDANGGSGAVPKDTSKYAKGDKVTVLSGTGLTKNGVVFAGWSYDKDATSVGLMPESAFTIDKSTTLYAVYIADTEVTFSYYDIGYDTGKKIKLKDIKYVKDQEVILPAYTEVGGKEKTFDGWNEGKPGSTIKADGDKEIYAQEGEKVEFTATISWDDGNNFDGSRPSPADFLDKVSLSPEPEDPKAKTIYNTEGNTWSITWSLLPKLADDKKYVLDVPAVEGYSLTVGETSAQYSRPVGEASVQLWITNKKWDKGGELIKFRAGSRVNFRLDITNTGNSTIDHVLVYKALKGVKFKSGSGYRITKDGYALIGELSPGETVYVYSYYYVTNADARDCKVANVEGCYFWRADGSWGESWDAVRIPIKKGSYTTTSTATATPAPTATPVPGTYMVDKLLTDVRNIKTTYPNTTFEIVGADQMLTSEEYATFRTLTTQDQILTILDVVGFDSLVAKDRLRLNLSMSQTAQDLAATVISRKNAMTETEKADWQAKQNIYFPMQTLTVNGVTQRYFDISLKINSTGLDHVDRYTFRETTGGEWEYVRMVTEQ